MNPGIQFVFGRFRLEPNNACLWLGSETIALRPRSFAVLCHLVRHHGQLVTKEQLLDAIWPRQYVSEGVLKVCINEIRQALGDDPKAPGYILTVARRGYRFMAEVTEFGEHSVNADMSGMTVLTSTFLRRPKDLYWVGREAFLEALTAASHRAFMGDRQMVFVSGEAGIGKTTLVNMFIDRMADQDPGVLYGRCVEQFGAEEAFLPLIEALLKCCRAPGGETLKAHLYRHAPTWLAQMPWICTPEEHETLRREILGASRQRMLLELCEALECLGQERALVLVLEDLHWSDHATLDLLSLLARRHERARLLVIGTYRSVDAVDGKHPLKTLKHELQIHDLCMELSLGVLSSAEVADYLAVRFPECGLPEALAAVIYRRSGGHPLFMISLVAYFLEQRRLIQSKGRWILSGGTGDSERALPKTLRQMIEHQIECLSQEEQRLLEVASVAGAEFSAALLAAALVRDHLEVENRCENLTRRCLMLSRAGVDEWPDGTVSGRYVLRHALYEEVLYQRLAPARRVYLHRCLGEYLESTQGERAAEIAAVLSLHFEQGRDYVRAIQYLRQAAENSARGFANREALAYLIRALALVGRFPEAERVDLRIELLQRCALVRRSLGDMQGAVEDLTVMLACARESGHRLGEIKALVDLGRVCIWLDRPRCLELAVEAVELSRDLDDEIMQTLVHGNHASWNLYLRGWRDDHAETCRETLAFARMRQDRQMINIRLPPQAMVEAWSSNYRAACIVTEEGMELAQSLGDGYQSMICQHYRIWALLHLGEWGEMRRFIGKALLASEKNGNLLTTCMFRQAGGMLHAEAFDFGVARSLYDQVIVAVKDLNHDVFMACKASTLILMGKAFLGLHDLPSAWRCFSEITPSMGKDHRDTVIDWIYYLPFHQAFSEYWLAQGDLVQARKQAAALCEKAGLAPERTYLALGHRLYAEVAIAERNWDEAQAQLSQALAIIEAPELPLAAWRVYATAETFHEQRGDRIEAANFRRRGAEVIHALAGSLDEGDPLHQTLLAHGLIRSASAA
ncbi:MAG: AAA family ATPase [Methylococcaceae bacterium]|nr:AAA family ATPase [Methylococcaceae bacterium]